MLALALTQALAVDGMRYRPDRVILMPKRGKAPDTLAQMHQAKGRRVLKSYDWLGGVQVVQLAAGEEVGEAIVRYRASGEVEFAEPDYKVHATAMPDDPEFRRGTQWSLNNTGQFGGKLGADISAVAAWDTIHSATNIIVAIVDSGIRYTHEDLAANMWKNPGEIPGNGIDDDRNGVIDDVYGIDAILNSGDPMDDAGHGTHVAGIIGAVGNNGMGTVGVAWNVKLMACRFLSKAGDGDTSDAIQCIDYARRMGAQVINASWGGADYSAALYNAINAARSAGMVFVTAAGNDAQNLDSVPLYPACYNLDNIVVVGATTRADLMDTSYSSYGASSCDIFAPGTGIYSTWNTWDGAYTSNSGTSMATPHVTGVVALMKARFTTYSPSQIISRLLATVDKLPGLDGKCRSGGRVNMARALGPTPAAGFSASVLSGEPPLSVNFTNTSFGEVASYRWAFGDGSAETTSTNASHVFEFPGTFAVQLRVVGVNGVTNSFSQEVKVAPNYISTNTPYAWVDPSGMQSFTLTDNGITSEQTLPFPFHFYGETYGSLFISANGVLSFSSDSLTISDNTTLPVATAPNGLICPYWDNLNPSAGGTVSAGVVGEAPKRRYVVSWIDVPRSSTAVKLSFQAILEEETQDIVFQYLEVQPNTSRGGAKRATVGVESAAGTTASLYTYNGSPVVIQNNTAVRFTQRPFRFLAVNIPGSLDFSAVHGEFPGAVAQAVQLRNAGNQSIRWEAKSPANWLSIGESTGTLARNETVTLNVALAPEVSSYSAARFATSIEFSNLDDGRGNRSLPVTLTVTEPLERLEAHLTTTNTFAGGLGGPFLPERATILLRNAGNVAIHWESTVSAPWIALSATEGDLAGGETIEVNATIIAADQLGSGRHEALLHFQVAGQSFGTDLPIAVQVNSSLAPHSALVTDGVFSGSFEIPIQGTYFIEASDDLVSWEILELEPKIVAGRITFEDSLGGGASRFYRLLVTP